MQRITKTTIEKLDMNAETRARDIVDAEVRGFGVRIRPGAKPSYYFRYQSPKMNKIRRLSIGVVNDISLDAARSLARQYREQVNQGFDPTNVRRCVGATVNDLWARYWAYAEKNYKPKTLYNLRYIWDRFVTPQIGHYPLKLVNRGDIIAVFSSVESQTMANHTRAWLNRAFRMAELWEMRPDNSNPCLHVKKHREVPRTRILSPDELRELWKALDYHEKDSHPVVVLARLALLTGARSGELKAAKLSDIDWTRKVLRLDDSKTGKGEIELTDEAIAVIKAAIRFGGCKYVVPGFYPGEPLKSPYHCWRRILRTAGIEDLNIHDLRHVFASYAHHSGATQRQIMDMLRHSDFQMSTRYIQGFTNARRTAAEKTVQSILGIATGNQAEDPPRP